MKRAVISGAVAAVLAGIASLPAEAGQGTAVGVRNTMEPDEFGFVLTRTKVDPGPAIIEYENTGEDPHDLRMKRKGSKRVLKMKELEPGDVDRLSPKLKADSNYVLWCSLPDHRSRGMEANLKVRKKR